MAQEHSRPEGITWAPDTHPCGSEEIPMSLELHHHDSARGIVDNVQRQMLLNKNTEPLESSHTELRAMLNN